MQEARFGLIIIGDEILSGKRADKHMPKVIELLARRGLNLSWAEYLGDDPQRITGALQRALAGSDVVFSCGGIGATPDDHTRQCAARALGQPLVLHNVHRLQMGVFPQGSRIIPNPYNKIPGFSCDGPGGGTVHFVPGFPVMAWPMIEAVLDTHHAHLFRQGAWLEKSVVVFGAMEATLTPTMERIEHDHPGVKVFSLPSVDHPQWGRHIELGVKGAPQAVQTAYDDLRRHLQPFGLEYGPELVR
jgi:molybdopterin-biosynthesis enzyme MoeA-like protein